MTFLANCVFTIICLLEMALNVQAICIPFKLNIPRTYNYIETTPNMLKTMFRFIDKKYELFIQLK